MLIHLSLLPVVWMSLVSGQDPEITERILPEIKRMGVTGRLRCVIINQLENPVYWIHKDNDMTISTDDKISVDNSLNTIVMGWPKYQVEKTADGMKVIYTVIINRLEPRDAGNYTCQIYVRGSTQHPSKDGEMVVLIPPAISQGKTTHTVSVKENENFNLTCDATGYPRPNITWVRVNGAVLPGGILKHQSPIFPITPVRPEHRGIYRCLADNNVRPPASHDATLLILFRPRARAVQHSYGQAASRMFDVTIECRIAGWPEPDLKWHKASLDGSQRIPITNDDKHTINILLNHANVLDPNERWLQMVIRSVTANDFGTYYCEGSNDLGVGEGSVHLFETSECQGANCPPEQQAWKNSATSLDSRTALYSRTALTLVLIHALGMWTIQHRNVEIN